MMFILWFDVDSLYLSYIFINQLMRCGQAFGCEVSGFGPLLDLDKIFFFL